MPLDMPEAHIRLIFAVMIYDAGLISERGLTREAVAAIGDTGRELAAIIVQSRVSMMPS